jgi:hypothetical protein
MDEDSLNEFLATQNAPKSELYLAYKQRQDERFAKYGWDFVSDATAHAIFDSLVRPSINDFLSVSKGVFVKKISEDIFHVITFKQGRYGHVFGWGISLSFVPHKWDEDGCKFHRTLKSARCDLFEYESNLIKSDPKTKFFPYNEIDINHGTVCFFDDVARAWENLQAVIRNWLGSIIALEDVLREARFQMNNREWEWPKLVYAFALARTGKLEEGLAVLDELMAQHQHFSSPELPKAMKKIAKID